MRSEIRARAEDGRFPFAAYPKGWFVVALSEEVPAGEVVPLRYFGRDLIAYRGDSGRVYVSDAYCPHLGANLAHGGVVEGESIRCPFHGWRFEAGDRCVEVPYCEAPPLRAGLDALVAREQDGVVYVFSDPSGGAPWELPALDEEGWTPRRSVVWRGLRTHAQEVFENTVDIAHIAPVHAGRGARLVGKPSRDGVRLRVKLEFEASGAVVGMPDQINDVFLDVSMLGLGSVVVSTHVRNVDVRARQRIYATPVDRDTIDLRGIVQVRETPDPVFTAALAEIFYAAYVEDFAKDFPIWENKRYLRRPLLAKGDGPIVLYRQWCAQFYDHGEAAGPRVARRPTPTSGRGLRGLLEPARERLVDVASLLRERVGRVRGEAGAAAEPPPATPPRPATPPAEPPAPRGALTTQPITSADEYFDTLERRFVPAAAAGVDAVFQWELGGDDTFHAHVRDGRIDVRRGAHASPTVALVMSADDYVRVVNGELDGTWAFTSGRGKVKGSLTAAMKMRSLFPA